MKPFRNKPSIARRLAFTIIEIMLAIGILAMVMTAIYATWIAILKGAKSGIKAAAEVQRSRIAMRTLEDAFNSTEMFVANMNYYLFVSDTSGDMAAVSLASRLPAGFPGVGRYGDQVVRRVSFYTQPGKDGMSDLILTQAPLLLATNNGVEAYTITLARDVTLFKLAFYDDRKNEWVEEWKSTNQLPKLVQIALGLGKSANNASKPYDLTTSLVALPSVAIQPDIQGGAAPLPPGSTANTNTGGLKGTRFNPNNPNQFQNPGQNPNQFQNPYQRPGQFTPGFGR